MQVETPKAEWLPYPAPDDTQRPQPARYGEPAQGAEQTAPSALIAVSDPLLYSEAAVWPQKSAPGCILQQAKAYEAQLLQLQKPSTHHVLKSSPRSSCGGLPGIDPDDDSNRRQLSYNKYESLGTDAWSNVTPAGGGISTN